jgi:hypothetical protein
VPSPQQAPALASATSPASTPHLPPGAPSAELPAPGGGWHGPGDAETPGGGLHEAPPNGGGPQGPGDGGTPSDRRPGPSPNDSTHLTADDAGEAHGHDASTDGLSDEKRDEIIATPKGSRPDPSDYLPREYIDKHLEKFDEGATRFMPESNLEKYGIAQRDGTSFVMPKSEADAMISANRGDPRAMETELGLPDGFLDSNKVIRVDIPDPEHFNLRIPSGNEAGANEQWIPGGRLPNGASEAVINGGDIPPDDYTVTGIFK